MFWELESVLITSCVSSSSSFVKQRQEMVTSSLVPLSKILIIRIPWHPCDQFSKFYNLQTRKGMQELTSCENTLN